jgi:hypothetical protein
MIFYVRFNELNIPFTFFGPSTRLVVPFRNNLKERLCSYRAWRALYDHTLKSIMRGYNMGKLKIKLHILGVG